MNSKSLSQNRTSAYLAWFAVAGFFLYQYILRVAPGILFQEFYQDFNLTAEQFSTLGAYYLYAYSFLQIPLGLVIDRVGVRRTILASILLCLGATALLAVAQTLWAVQLSRILMGAGSAAAFMGALKTAADHLPPGKRGLLMGLTLSMGTVGALVAGKPLVLLVEAFDWRLALWCVFGLGLIIFSIVFWLVPNKKKQGESFEKTESIFSIGIQILSILKNWPVMVYAILAVGLYTPLAVLADLWGTAFLVEKFQLPRADAAQTVMMMYVGLAVGSCLMPWLCEKFGILNRAIRFASIMLLILFSVLIYGPAFSILILAVLLLAIGFFCGGEMMCFTGAAQFTTPQNSGITLGVVNTMNMLGGAAIQHLVGVSLDWQWQGSVNEMGVRMYSTEQFSTALSILIFVLAGCSAISFFLRHRHHTTVQSTA